MKRALILVFLAVILVGPVSFVFSSEQDESLHVKVAVLKNFPPQYLLSQNGDPQGFAIDIIEEIAKLAKLNIEYVIKDNWSEMFESLKSGQTDLIPNIGITDRRDQWFDYSQSVETFPVSIFVRKNGVEFQTIQDLRGNKVAVIKLNVGEVLVKDHPNIIVQQYDYAEKALFSLLSGSVDAMIYPTPVLWKIARDAKIDDKIKVTGEPLVEIKRAISVAKDNKLLLQRINIAVEQFVGSKRYNEIYTHWYGEPEYYWTTKKVFGSMFGLLFLVTFFMGIWKYRSTAHLNLELNRNIENRLSAEKKLQVAYDSLEEKVDHRTAELSDINARLQSILSAAPTGIGLIIDRVIIEVNITICQMLGRTEDELIGKSARMLYPTQEEFELVGTKKYTLIADNGTGTVETHWIRKDGSILNVLLSSTPINPEDLSVGVTFTATDITQRIQAEAEKEKLEEQLRQVYKMEAVGTMAGGIAHDFNNILAIIIGNAEMARDDIPLGNPIRHSFDEILQASNRACELVKQILAFSRKEKAELVSIRPQSVLEETLKLLRSTTPQTVSIVQEISQECHAVLANQTQLDQLIINLFANAVHAMDEKGQVAVRLEEVDLDRVAFDHFPVVLPIGFNKSGRYAKLSISDTGNGIDTEAINRIFDPFYTTKDVGKGTGMGLSVVYGIVESHGGFLTVNSQVGKGSTFSVYLPITEQEELIEFDTTTRNSTGTEQILLIDDEESLLAMTKRMLTSLGYKVVCEDSSIKALEIFKSNPEQFNLIITDQSMPELSGAELIEQVVKIKPGMPIILYSGFSTKVSEENSKEKGISKYISKPFTKKSLASAVREVLDVKM